MNDRPRRRCRRQARRPVRRSGRGLRLADDRGTSSTTSASPSPGRCSTPARVPRARSGCTTRTIGSGRTVDMARHRFGRGEYRYFGDPLPGPVERAARRLLAAAAADRSHWAERAGSRHRGRTSSTTGSSGATPPGSDDRRRCCCATARVTGTRSTATSTASCSSRCRSSSGSTSRAVDYTGGEFVVVEQRPRAQSRATTIAIRRAARWSLTTRDRPIRSRAWLGQHAASAWGERRPQPAVATRSASSSTTPPERRMARPDRLVQARSRRQARSFSRARSTAANGNRRTQKESRTTARATPGRRTSSARRRPGCRPATRSAHRRSRGRPRRPAPMSNRTAPAWSRRSPASATRQSKEETSQGRPVRSLPTTPAGGPRCSRCRTPFRVTPCASGRR